MSASYGLRNKLIDSGVLAGCVVASAWLSVGMGQDANWDLQNYHFYNPWAWWNGRIFTWDVAAAQLQTYHNALLDLPFFAMVAAAWPPQAIAAANAIPAGIAAFFLYKLLGVLFADLPRGERLLARALVSLPDAALPRSTLIGAISGSSPHGEANTKLWLVATARIRWKTWCFSRSACWRRSLSSLPKSRSATRACPQPTC